jgi:hypothetical protein
MAHSAGHVALLGPSAIAIHDDGNVLGQCGWGLYGHELRLKSQWARYRPFTQKQSFLLSIGNDKFKTLLLSDFVLVKCAIAITQHSH